MPLVSVIMAVYNGERYLREAVDSVLAQTCRDLELIVIDDGSTDGTAGVLAGYADPRLKVLVNRSNRGLTRSLNIGLAQAGGVFIVRQDADDRSVPERVERQVAFMEAHPDVVISGTAVAWMDETGRAVGIEDEPPRGDAAIRWTLLLHNAFRHSSVIVRREVLERHELRYDDALRYAQDYDLWSRVMRHGLAANLGDRLVWMRNHAGSVTQTKHAEQQEIADRIAAANLASAGVAFDVGAVRLMRAAPDALSQPERMARAAGLLKLFRCAFPPADHDVELRQMRDVFLWQVRQELMRAPLSPAAWPAWGGWMLARMGSRRKTMDRGGR